MRGKLLLTLRGHLCEAAIVHYQCDTQRNHHRNRDPIEGENNLRMSNGLQCGIEFPRRAFRADGRRRTA